MTATTSTLSEGTILEVDQALPTIRMTRDFDASPERVFRAYIDPALVVRWLGPDETEMRLDTWDARTGGAYSYAAVRGGAVIAEFYGSFHEVRPSSRLVQTFTFRGVPDGVSLETVTFEPLDGGRTRVVTFSVVYLIKTRDMILASGMATGVAQGHVKLDRLLAES